MANKFIDYLIVGKGYTEAKAKSLYNTLKREEATHPEIANHLLEDTLRFHEMVTLLKEYILCEEEGPELIRISRAEFEKHFHIIEPNNRGRKPKGFYTHSIESADDSAGDNIFNIGEE